MNRSRLRVRLFTHDLEIYAAGAGAVIKINQNDLLPGTQCQLLADKGNS